MAENQFSEREEQYFQENDAPSSADTVDIMNMEEDSPAEDPSISDTLSDKGGSSTTAMERKEAAESAAKELEGLINSVNRMCRQSDPQFVQVGRDLTIVTRSVKSLSDTVHTAVSLIQSDKEGDASLKKTESLVQEVFTSISEGRKTIGNDAAQVKNLVQQIFQCERIREMIDRINSLFRIVRINIRIQCSARGLNDELFEGVSEDLEALSKSLHTITKQILRDMNQGAKNLTRLQKSIAEHMKHIDTVFQETKSVTSKAFYDIRQLMHGTQTMIQEADSRSRKVSEKVGAVVVSIQFHDSLSQRSEHINKAFQDIIRLFSNKEEDISEEHLGTAFIILELQIRQLIQISKEIKLIHERIDNEFQSIESEVEGVSSILHDAQFRQVGPQQFLSSLFVSLENTLVKLNNLLAEGEGMMQKVEQTTAETRTIADNLKDLQENVIEIREETRVQAVNTIIMASSLGQKGRTIEVLAKEIQTLSDQSGVLADDVWSMYMNVNQTIEELIASTRNNEKHLGREKLAQEIDTIKKSFSGIMEVVADITRYIDLTSEHIQNTRSSLLFLDKLENTLNTILAGVDRVRDTLAPWEGMGTHDSEEVEQLIQRYSMEQERMIHMFDRVETKEGTEEEEDVLF